MAENNYTPSRLLISSSALREDLIVRNLYTPNTEYSESSGKINERIINSLSTIIGVITPFKSYNLKNTVYGRLIENESMLSRIGLTMLGKQLAYNASSSLLQEFAPIINKNSTYNNPNPKLFTKQIDYAITSKSGTTTFKDFINKTFYYYPVNRFGKLSDNNDYINNTGKGQLKQLFTSLNRNIYKPENSSINDAYYKRADEVGVPIVDRKVVINFDDKIYFAFNENPYYSLPLKNSTLVSMTKANSNMIESMNILYDHQEYAPSREIVESYFGNTNSLYNQTSSETLDYYGDVNMNSWINSQSEFNNENIKNRIVWGRDGATDEVNENSRKLRGLENNDDINRNEDLSSNKFNVKTGLLEYTRNLINATEGRIGDLTRKAFTNGNNIDGFNGSAVWKAPSTSLLNFAGKTGVRQHSVLDPYDRFSKAIRFNGNIEYESAGNQDSVIYKSVIPKFHPTLNKNGDVDNTNMMFSIENLAVKVIDNKEGSGIIDDEYGSEIPVCEVGPFNGRIMWFPPYDIEINETSVAKFESTVMVGRGEPVYNYQNSERSATINFTLLVDYTDKLKGLKNHKEIAEFFAFGTTKKVDDKKFIENSQKRILEIDIQLEDYTEEDYSEPQLTPNSDISIYFPNAIPEPKDNLNTVIDKVFNEYSYEILSIVFSSDNGLYGLNKPIYYISGLTEYHVSNKAYFKFDVGEPSYSQYTVTATTDSFHTVTINEKIKNYFDDEEFRKYYRIHIVGGATKLYTPEDSTDIVTGDEYNRDLGLRRANAAKSFIEQKLLAFYNKSADQMGIKITTDTVGSELASDSSSTLESLSTLTAKKERYAIISFIQNDVSAGKKEKTLSEDQKREKLSLIEERETLQSGINTAKNKINDCIMNEREEDDTAILNASKSITGNYFYPVFHSQTPEDFHKRLTFLQQCTRQGAAIRYDSVIDKNNIVRSRNSVFGRQPICILRIGDFFYTKIIIESLNIDYNETTWDMNPEGFGMQPMLANVTLNVKVMGGQSLKGPIDALQNAVSFNYYANSSFSNEGLYKKPYETALEQNKYRREQLDSESKFLYNKKYPNKTK